MSAHPKEQAEDTVPFYSRPKEERDAILRAAGIRPALSDGKPRFDMEPIRLRPSLRRFLMRWFERW